MNRTKRNEERAARYRELAEKAKVRSDAAAQKSSQIASMIPMGQPILVGHHSERRHRRDIERIDRAMGKAVEEQKKAEYYAEKAITAESNRTIYSDDDQAIEKLQEKLAKKVKLQEMMKAANVIYRKPKSEENIEKLMALGLTRENALAGYEPSHCCRIGFPSYALQNNNAEIRRIKARIETVSKMQARPEVAIEVGKAEVRENAEFNSIEISFPGKPAQEIIDELKSNGFRWAGRSKVWYRKGRTDHLLEVAKKIAGKAA